MKLLADEGVDKPIVDLLRASGFDVDYILETNGGIEDERVNQVNRPVVMLTATIALNHILF